MKRFITIGVLGAAALAAPLRMVPQINNADARGYFARGVAMYQDRNYNGCIDQLLQLRNLNATPDEQRDALYYVAMSTYHCGDDEALDLLREYLSRYPQSPMCGDVTMTAGDYFFTRGIYADALKEYVKVSPESVTADRADDLMYRTAYCYMFLGEYGKAKGMFSRLTSTSVYGNAAKFYLAYMEYSERNYAKAIEMFETVDVTREPGQAAMYYLSQLYYMEKDYGKSLAMARKAIVSGAVPEFEPELNRVAGESLYNMGDTSEAVAYLQKYVSSTDNPEPSACYMLGVCHYNDADYATAAEFLKRAVSGDSAMGQSAYLYLGQCFVKTGNRDAALMAFENAFKNSVDVNVAETAFYNYIVARMDGGRIPFGNSVSLMEEFLRKYPASPYADDIRENLVSGYMSDNDYDSALRIIRNVKSPSVKMNQARQRVLFMLGTREYAASNVDKATGYLEEAAEVRGGEPDVTRQCALWLGNCYFDRGDYTDAADEYIKYLDGAPANDENRALALYNLGYARFMDERYEEASTDFRRAIESSGATAVIKADSYNRLGDCCYYDRRYSDAADYYNKAYSSNRSAGDYALYQMAVMKGMARDYNGKIAGLDDMMDRFPTSALVPEALLDKAEAYVAIGRNSNAIETYSQLVREYPSTAQGRNGYLQLAITQLGMGNRQAAIDAYKKVIYTYPTSDEAMVAVEDLKRIYAEDGRLAEFADFVNSIPNAPRIDPSQLDAIAFQTAENEYLNHQRITKLQDYLTDYPHGAYEAQTLYYLAEAASASGNTADAVEYAAKIAVEHPDAEVAEDALLIKATGERAQGKLALAFDSYQELEQRASTPRNLHEARLGEMRTALDLERYSEVIAVADKLLASSAASSDETSEIRFSRAYALDCSGNMDEAYAEWETLAANPADENGAKSAVFMGESLLRAHKYDEAKTVADRMINKGTPHNYWLARAFIVLSDALRAKGDTFEADEYLKSLRNNYPDRDNEDIFRMIDERLVKE